MKRYAIGVLLSTAAAAMLLVTPILGAAQGKEQVMKVGKTGNIELTYETRVGDVTLKPGPYKVQHRVQGTDHFVHFTELTKGHPSHGGLGGAAAKAHPGEVKCTLEPLKEKATQTEVHMVEESGTMRVTRIVVRGEDVAHIF